MKTLRFFSWWLKFRYGGYFSRKSDHFSGVFLMLLSVCFALNPFVLLPVFITLVRHPEILHWIFKYTISHTHLVRVEGDDNDLSVMLYAIWHYLHNLKDVKSTHGGVLLYWKQRSFMGVFLVSWIVQMVPNRANHHK